jgi:crotonobetainyl-CoA:carnitine CoA-transferase CaiB-like acyl-CoA transferase
MSENRRLSGGYKYGDYLLRQVFACQDGHVAITFLFGNAMGPFTRRLMEWVHAEGFCDDATRDIDWIGYGELLMHSKVPHDDFERLKQTLETFTRTKTKDELLHAALTKRLLVAPVATIAEVVANDQLASRDYWRQVDGMRTPGPFVKFSAAPIEYRRAAPRIGEHNREVYVDELGLSEAELAELQAKGVV